MAKYEDYVKKMSEAGQSDGLQKEIETAQQSTEVRQTAEPTGFVVPDEFKGKTTEDVIKDYTELQQAYSRQGNDMGTLRKTVDQLILNDASSVADTRQQQDTVKPVTVDDLYENADDSIRRVVRDESSSQLDETKKELANLRAEIAYSTFQNSNEGWKEKVESPKFQNWVNDSTYRQRMWADANQYDFDAANDLISMYDDHVGVTTDQSKQDRSQQLNAAGLESSGASGEYENTDTFSRAELMNVRIKAKQGNDNAREWLKINNPAITRAYAEGRISD
jgi:hypothetical protein